MSTPSVQVGRFRITALDDARFALDGGAMFGVVPRVLWQKLTPVNEDHTIPLATHPFLIEDGEHRVVIEPGLGRRWGDRERSMFHIDHGDGHDLIESLAAAGVDPGEISHCLMSHCHWDHIGAACDENGAPVFPHAAHWTPASEREACLNPDHLRRASYRREDLAPIEKAGLLHTFDQAVEVLPGISMVELGGHSDGVSLILIQGGDGPGETACFWSDVVPTRNHVHLPFIMAYDLDASRSWEQRSEWIPRAAEAGWVALLYHDPVSPIGRFVAGERRFAWQEINKS